jgi:hypothetical protein
MVGEEQWVVTRQASRAMLYLWLGMARLGMARLGMARQGKLAGGMSAAGGYERG